MNEHQTVWSFADGRWTAVMVIEPPKRPQSNADEDAEVDDTPDTVESAPDTERDLDPLTMSSF